MTNSIRLVDRFLIYKGFEIQDIEYSGNYWIESTFINDISKKLYGNNMLFANIYDIKNSIQKNHWVSKVYIKKVFPSKISIKIIEKKPFALWNDSFILSKEGDIIIDNLSEYINNNKNIDINYLIKLRTDIEDNIDDFNILIKTLESYPKIYNNLKFLYKNESKMWDIKLNNGFVIKLPGSFEKYNQYLDKIYSIIKQDYNLYIKESNITVDTRTPSKIYLKE